jgi:hypothetical protein
VARQSQPQQQQSFASCVADGGKIFSLQGMLQFVSGGHLGDGFFSDAFLGNTVSTLIEIAQAASSGSGTGKERDSETGDDNFGGTFGRFMTPDSHFVMHRDDQQDQTINIQTVMPTLSTSVQSGPQPK